MPCKQWLAVPLLMLALMPGAAFATDHTDTAMAETSAEAPSMELLEFLGDWDDGDDQWIDPTELEEWMPPKQEPDYED